jgi:hypothetical protein
MVSLSSQVRRLAAWSWPSGVPTDQIARVTAGTIVDYTYDAKGKLTNDGAQIGLEPR